MLYWVGKSLGRIICRIFGRWHVIGRGNIPTEGGVLLCGNHVSYIDPPALGGASPRQVHFMAKIELFEVPILGSIIRRVGSFPVKRGKADRTALKTAVTLLRAGKVVGLFPEGKRSEDGKLQEAEPGVGMIVLMAQVPVIPVALIGTDDLLPKGKRFFQMSSVKVVFGPPVKLDDLYGKSGREVVEEVSRRIMDGIRRLQAEWIVSD